MRRRVDCLGGSNFWIGRWKFDYYDWRKIRVVFNMKNVEEKSKKFEHIGLIYKS